MRRANTESLRCRSGALGLAEFSRPIMKPFHRSRLARIWSQRAIRLALEFQFLLVSGWTVDRLSQRGRATDLRLCQFAVPYPARPVVNMNHALSKLSRARHPRSFASKRWENASSKLPPERGLATKNVRNEELKRGEPNTVGFRQACSRQADGRGRPSTRIHRRLFW